MTGPGGGVSMALGMSDVHVSDKTPFSTARSHTWKVEEQGQGVSAGGEQADAFSHHGRTEPQMKAMGSRLRAGTNKLVEMNEAGENAILVALMPPFDDSDPKNPKVTLTSHVVVCGMPTNVREFMAPLRSEQLSAGKKRFQVRFCRRPAWHGLRCMYVA